MKLLKDDELLAYINTPNPMIKGIDPPADWYSADSPVQSSSIDLRIGSIFLPGKQRDDPGGESRPMAEHILEPGQTAIVTTLEEFSLPGSMAGIGFPPSTVSFRGILMTNPGHIDPGYAGRMRFTLINMGNGGYPLKRKEVIVTVLLFELSAPAQRNWVQRRSGNAAASPTQDNIDRLSADFMDIKNRADEIAKKAVAAADLAFKKSEARVKWWGIITPILVVFVAGVFSLWQLYAKPSWEKPIEDVKKEIAVLKASLDLSDIRSKVDEHDRILKGTKEVPQSSGAR